MALRTTVIGSFPKPDYLNLSDWFQTGASSGGGDATKQYTEQIANMSAEEKSKLEQDIMRATGEVIEIQKKCGINVVTDGEIPRDNYIHYLCRFIEGIDFNDLTETSCRNGAYVTALPTVCGKVSWRGPLDVVQEWKKAQDLSGDVDVKYTLPGPMTIIGTLNNQFYKEEKELAEDLAVIINFHTRALASAGCKNLQIDEPVFARRPKEALDWGIGLLEKCFEGVGKDCEKVVHMCCGYPGFLDDKDYHKADPSAYFQLADAIDKSCVDAVSIEDAHRPNDLSLLEKFKKTTVILGLVNSSSSQVESVEKIQARLEEALEHIEPERLMVAPDCGLGFLPLPILKQKLTNMCSATNRCRCRRFKMWPQIDSIPVEAIEETYQLFSLDQECAFENDPIATPKSGLGQLPLPILDQGSQICCLAIANAGG